MKFLLRSILTTILYMLIFIIPVSLFITIFSLGQSSTPLWNIGLRNIVRHSAGHYVPAILISYLISTLLVVALVDKMKVRSLAMLHIPAIIVACAIGAGLYFGGREEPFPLPRAGISLGPSSFLKHDVFTPVAGRQIQWKSGRGNGSRLYYYDTLENSFSIIPSITTGEGKGNRMWVDDQKREVVISARKSLPGGGVRIPYSDFPRRRNTTDLGIFRVYANQIRGIQTSVISRTGSLGRREAYIFLGSLLITLLMIAIPLSYGMNDRGWAFSGITGVIFILAILPFFYNYAFLAIERVESRISIMGSYSYLLPSVVFGICGIVLDLIMARGRAKS